MPYPNTILKAAAHSGRSERDISIAAVGHESAIRSLKRGLDARASTLEALCRELGLEFYIGPPRGGAAAESPGEPPPAWQSFTEATLPHKGLASCSVQGWGKNQPLRDPLPKPETVMDEDAFYVSASGQSMIPEGIDGGAICLVSPGTEVRDGDRVWVLDHQGLAAIKRLIKRGEDGRLFLRGWMPKRDGQQKSFEEERFAAGIREVYPVVAVFRGKPGSENCEYIPDPKPPAHADPSNIAPLERIPKPVTDLLGLPEGASADAVVAAIQTRLTGRGTAHASPVAALDKRSMGQLLDSKLKSETRALEAKLAKKLDALADRLQSPAEAATEAAGIHRLFMRIARDVHAEGGTGEEILQEATDRVMIAADDLPRNLDVERVVAIRATGYSMEPTIRTDDILVLNLDETEPREGAIFVVRTDTGLVVKRLQQDGDAWTMVSDAGDRDPRPVAEGDRIVGRVVWFGPEGAIVVGG